MAVEAADAGIPPSLLALLAARVAEFGPETVERAVENAQMFDGLRPLSRLSLKTAATCIEEGFPATLVFQFDPKQKSRGERVEVRVLTGNEIGIHGS